eukprot:3195868-Amphidinium_carterae.1
MLFGSGLLPWARSLSTALRTVVPLTLHYTYCGAVFSPSTRISSDTSLARCVTPGQLSWMTRSWPFYNKLFNWVSSTNNNVTSCPSRSGMEAWASHSSSRKGSSIMRGPSWRCKRVSH